LEIKGQQTLDFSHFVSSFPRIRESMLLGQYKYAYAFSPYCSVWKLPLI